MVVPLPGPSSSGPGAKWGDLSPPPFCDTRAMPSFDGDVLRARGLVKRYKRIRAVDGIDLTVGAGERVALLGPNGAGKTTTLMMLLGVVTPDDGHGRDRRAPPPARAQRRRSSTSGSPPATCPCPSGSGSREFLDAVRPPLRARATPAPRSRPGLERFGITAPRRRDGQRAVVGPADARRHRQGDAAPARRCSCSTSRPPRSTPTSPCGPHRPRAGCAPRRAPRCSSRATTWSRSSGCASGSCSSRPAGSSPTAPPARSRRASAATTSRACSCTSPRTASPTASMRGRRGDVSWLTGSRAIARRHAYVLQRAPQRWFDVVVWPVVDAVLFGAIGVYFGEQPGAGRPGVAFLLAGILLFHVVFQAEVSLATGFLEETWSRNLLNLMVTPLRELRVRRRGRAVRPGQARARRQRRVDRRVRCCSRSTITDLGLALDPDGRDPAARRAGRSALIVIGLILRVGQGAEILAWGLHRDADAAVGDLLPGRARCPGSSSRSPRCCPTTHVFAAAREVLDGRPDAVGRARRSPPSARSCSRSRSAWFLMRMLRRLPRPRATSAATCRAAAVRRRAQRERGDGAGVGDGRWPRRRASSTHRRPCRSKPSPRVLPMRNRAWMPSTMIASL